MDAVYRYRTPDVAGPWRTSRKEAVNDAVEAGFAFRKEDSAFACKWLITGGIEVADPGDASIQEPLSRAAIEAWGDSIASTLLKATADYEGQARRITAMIEAEARLKAETDRS